MASNIRVSITSLYVSSSVSLTQKFPTTSESGMSEDATERETPDSVARTEKRSFIMVFLLWFSQ